MKDLLINLYFNKNVIPKKDIKDKTNILDFSGQFKKNTVILSEIDNYNNIYKSALQDFVKFSESVSQRKYKNRHIRNFKFLDLPIYWLTDTSLKHPHLNYILNIFIVKRILENNSNFNKNYNITVYFENNINIIHYILQDVDKSINYVKIKKNNYLIFPRIIKTFIAISYKILKNKTKFTTKKVKNIILILPEKPTFYTFKFFENIKIQAKACHKEVHTTTFQKVNYEFLTITGLLKVLYKIIFLWFKIRVNNPTIKNKEINFFLKEELSNVIIKKISLLLTYYALKKLTEKLKTQISIFYEDEFYETGRIISKAFSNNINCKTYGMQHGVISEEHTVYNISDIEITDINEKDAMPIPDKFIVWGEYYKNIFLKNNNLPHNYVIPAGNISYIKKDKKPGVVKNNPKKILYCFTLKEVFIKEIQIIKDLNFINKNYNIEFRFHPLHKFDIKIIKETLNISNVTISNYENIETAILNSDIILTSAHSTIYLDAIVYKKPVIRLITKTDSLSNNITGVYNCKNNHEFLTAFRKISKSETNNTTNNELLTSTPAFWDKILCN